jgi:orotidine-5'-phosphate decarboxylase
MKRLHPIYIALDFETGQEALNFLGKNRLDEVPVKVGMQLYYREGPEIIERLKEQGHPLFLDLKLHDIPTTVNKAMANLAKLGVDMVNIHAQGGTDMMYAAKEGLETGSQSKSSPTLLAVTQLTSTDEDMLRNELLLTGTVEDSVIHYAKLAKQAGVDGVVCSAHEVPGIKEANGGAFITVTPGIRLQDNAVNDQKRVAIPKIARSQGTDSIVVGRSVTQAENPKLNYQKIMEEWDHVYRT